MRLDTRFLGAVARASVRSELAEEAAERAAAQADDGDDESGLAGSGRAYDLGDLPELRDAMSLVWRCLLVWLAVLALFVIAGFVS